MQIPTTVGKHKSSICRFYSNLEKDVSGNSKIRILGKAGYIILKKSTKCKSSNLRKGTKTEKQHSVRNRGHRFKRRIVSTFIKNFQKK